MRDLGVCLGRLPWEGRFYRRQASSQLRPTFRPEVGVPEPAPLSGPGSQAWAPCGTPAPCGSGTAGGGAGGPGCRSPASLAAGRYVQET